MAHVEWQLGASDDEIRSRVWELAAERGAAISSIASDIITLFIVSVARESAPVEGATEEAAAEWTDRATSFQQQLIESLPSAFEVLVTDAMNGQRPPALQGVITAPDVFHWMTRTGAEGLALAWCPFPSTF